MTDMTIWARPLGDVAYLLVGAGVGRYMGGRWAWHLAQSGTLNTDVRADMRKGFYRDALGRPTKEALRLRHDGGVYHHFRSFKQIIFSPGEAARRLACATQARRHK